MKKIVEKIKNKLLESKVYKGYVAFCTPRNFALSALAVIVVFVLTVMLFSMRSGKCGLENNSTSSNSEPEIIYIDKEFVVERETIISAMGKASELVTYKYYVADFDVLEKDKKFFGVKVPFTTDQTVFAFRGTVSVGVRDMGDVEVTVNEEEKKIMIVIPELEVLYNVMDSFKTLDVKKSVFTEISLAEHEDFRQALLDRQVKDLEDNKEFWDSAKDNTTKILESLFISIPGIADYSISYSWK